MKCDFFLPALIVLIHRAIFKKIGIRTIVFRELLVKGLNLNPV